ncbi:hypothetical protein SUGI_0258450 [Cryptomeria japonica]|nr:hypothetical protein SUGI_0258450 [Cryptomeria japonica]
MDRYQRVEKPKPDTAINQNEIRVTTQGLIWNYISYCIYLLQDKATPEIVLKAMCQAISKVVAIAEIIKQRVPDLHQITSISSTSITDVWEPIEEGCSTVNVVQNTEMILSRNVDPNSSAADFVAVDLAVTGVEQQIDAMKLYLKE